MRLGGRKGIDSVARVQHPESTAYPDGDRRVAGRMLADMARIAKRQRAKTIIVSFELLVEHASLALFLHYETTSERLLFIDAVLLFIDAILFRIPPSDFIH